MSARHLVPVSRTKNEIVAICPSKRHKTLFNNQLETIPRRPMQRKRGRHPLQTQAGKVLLWRPDPFFHNPRPPPAAPNATETKSSPLPKKTINPSLTFTLTKPDLSLPRRLVYRKRNNRCSPTNPLRLRPTLSRGIPWSENEIVTAVQASQNKPPTSTYSFTHSPTSYYTRRAV